MLNREKSRRNSWDSTNYVLVKRLSAEAGICRLGCCFHFPFIFVTQFAPTPCVMVVVLFTQFHERYSSPISHSALISSTRTNIKVFVLFCFANRVDLYVIEVNLPCCAGQLGAIECVKLKSKGGKTQSMCTVRYIVDSARTAFTLFCSLCKDGEYISMVHYFAF